MGGHMVECRTPREFRLRAGLTVKALAKKAKVSEAAIEAIESGTRERSHDATLFAISKALGIDRVEYDRAIRNAKEDREKETHAERSSGEAPQAT